MLIQILLNCLYNMKRLRIEAQRSFLKNFVFSEVIWVVDDVEWFSLAATPYNQQWYIYFREYFYEIYCLVRCDRGYKELVVYYYFGVLTDVVEWYQLLLSIVVFILEVCLLN